MYVLIAIASALSWGTGDFLGGVASRRSDPVRVTLIAELVGMIGVVGGALILGGSPSSGDLWLGTVAGLAGGVALVLFYRGLGIGPIAVVAPVSAVCAAAVPVAAGVLWGSAPTALQGVGIVLGLVGIGLVASGHSPEDAGGDEGVDAGATAAPAGASGLVLAVAAGLGFGGYLAAMGRTSHEAGLWPLVSGRAAASVLLMLIVGWQVVRSKRAASGEAQAQVNGAVRADAALADAARSASTVDTTVASPGSFLGSLVHPLDRIPAAAAGFFDAFGNIFYMLAARQGPLAIVGLISSMYPASTVALDRLVHHERIARTQIVGVAVLFAALVALVWHG